MVISDKKLLEELKVVSERMGNNLDLIQANGGNTSIKIDDYIIIKGSGKELSKANVENIFAKVTIKTKGSIKKEVKQKIELDNHNKYIGLKPSIELPLHLLMSAKVVLHSHPIDLITLTLLSDGKKKIKKLLKDFNWIWIDYYKPGNELADAVNKSLKKQKADIIILQNHGLVVGGESPIEAEKLQTELLEKIRLKKRDYSFNNLYQLKALKEKYPNLIKIPKYEVIHSIATDEWSQKLSQKNSHCPDHAVFCGIRPPIINNTKQDFNKLSEEHSYVILKNVGVIILKNSNAIEALLRSQAEIFLKIPINNKVKLLTDTQCMDLINWDAEKLRIKLIK